MVQYERPILYFNSGNEDKEAYSSVVESRIPCEFRAHAEEPTPMLRVGFERHTGIDEIKGFIREWKTEHKEE